MMSFRDVIDDLRTTREKSIFLWQPNVYRDSQEDYLGCLQFDQEDSSLTVKRQVEYKIDQGCETGVNSNINLQCGESTPGAWSLCIEGNLNLGCLC